MQTKQSASIVKYIKAHWKPEAPLASIFPLLRNLVETEGPGWRLDRIVQLNEVQPYAVKNTTFEFLCNGDPNMYAIWRNGEDDSACSL